MAPPTSRLQIAFTSDTLDATPSWQDMDDLVRISSYSIDRGRNYELDRVDVGRASITINDTDGTLDPTNSSGTFYNYINPLKQARLAMWNPVLEDWYTRYRGFVESWEYAFDPSQLVNVVTINLVDVFEIVQATQMFPGAFGDPPPTDDVVFMAATLTGEDPAHGMQRRVVDIIGDIGDSSFALGSVGLPSQFYDVFSGNVTLHEGTYSPGESAMAAVQEAVDAEFPGVGNVYCDRLGILAVHGRYARFDPVGTSAATGWDFRDWKAGDGAAVIASPTDTAHIRTFATSKDVGKLINVGSASPKTNETVEDFTTQVVQDLTSKGLYGIRAWSTSGLLTKEGITDGDTIASYGDQAAWRQTKRFAQYYVDNYAEPHQRVTQISFRSQDLAATGAAANWALLAEVDLNDRVALTIGSPGGGGIAYNGAHPTWNQYFVEGIHEEHRPLNDTMDDVTLTLDLSPARYFDDSPFAT